MDIYYSRKEAESVIDYCIATGTGRNSEGIIPEKKVVRNYDKSNEIGNGKYYYTIKELS